MRPDVELLLESSKISIFSESTRLSTQLNLLMRNANNTKRYNSGIFAVQSWKFCTKARSLPTMKVWADCVVHIDHSSSFLLYVNFYLEFLSLQKKCNNCKHLVETIRF